MSTFDARDEDAIRRLKEDPDRFFAEDRLKRNPKVMAPLERAERYLALATFWAGVSVGAVVTGMLITIWVLVSL